MSTFIKIKRRLVGADPVAGDLKEGELAYAFTSDKLFIGGAAGVTVIEIGGNAFTDLLTATHGAATPDKAVILGSATEIDFWNVVGLVTAGSFKTSATVAAGFVKNDASGNFLFGQAGGAGGEINDLTAAVTWANVPDANVTQSSVVQHEAALTITESQISDLQAYVLPADSIDILADVDTTTVAPISGDHLEWNGTNWVPAVPGHTVEANDLTSAVTWANVPDANVTQSSVVQHEAALTITESQISDLQSYVLPTDSIDILADVDTTTVTPASGDHLEWNGTNWVPAVPGHTVEANDLTSAVVWANVPDANITQSSVVQHEAALTITESQISDLQAYLTVETNDLTAAVTWANVPDANVTQSSVVQHEAALTITESQISDLQAYLLDITGQSLDDLSDVNAASPSDGQVLTWVNGSTEWQAVTPAGGGATDLNSLTDVTLTAASTGDFLRKSAGDWLNTTIVDADVPNTLTLDEIRAGDQAVIRCYDNTSFATWLLKIGTGSTGDIGPRIIGSNQAETAGGLQLETESGTIRLLPGGSAPAAGVLSVNASGDILFNQASLNDLSDVVVTSPTTDSPLVWDGANWIDSLTVALTQINDFGGVAFVVLQKSSLPVNAWRLYNADTGVAPQLQVIGTDTNIDMELNTKGTGDFIFATGLGATEIIRFTDTGNLQLKQVGGEIQVPWGDTGLLFGSPGFSQKFLRVRRHSNLSGSNYIEIWAGGNVGVNPSIRINGPAAFSEGLSLHTKGSGAFRLLPGGSAPAAGLLGCDSSGDILFNQSVTDTDVPNTLTLDLIKAPWSSTGLIITGGNNLQNLLTVRRYANLSGTNWLEIWSAGNVGQDASIRVTGPVAFSEGLELHTKGSGVFTLLPGGSAPAAGLLGVNASGNILFNQAAGSTTLAGLTDTIISSPTLYEPLVWNGANWVNDTKIKVGEIYGPLGPKGFEINANVSAVNYIQVDSKVASHAVGPGFSSFGTDTNINLKLQAKGTGVVLVRLSDLTVDAGDLYVSAGDLFVTAGDVFVSSSNAYYWGDATTDGTWRIIRQTDDLLIQQRESGSYNTKSTIPGA